MEAIQQEDDQRDTNHNIQISKISETAETTETTKTKDVDLHPPSNNLENLQYLKDLETIRINEKQKMVTYSQKELSDIVSIINKMPVQDHISILSLLRQDSINYTKRGTTRIELNLNSINPSNTLEKIVELVISFQQKIYKIK